MSTLPCKQFLKLNMWLIYIVACYQLHNTGARWNLVETDCLLSHQKFCYKLIFRVMIRRYLIYFVFLLAIYAYSFFFLFPPFLPVFSCSIFEQVWSPQDFGDKRQKLTKLDVKLFYYKWPQRVLKFEPAEHILQTHVHVVQLSKLRQSL